MLRMLSAVWAFVLAPVLLITALLRPLLVLRVALIAALVLAFAPLAIVNPAFAQAAADTSYDISAIRDQVLSGLAVFLTAQAVALFEYGRRWLATKTKYADSAAAIALQKGWNEIVALGMAKAEGKAKAIIPGTINVNSEWLREGVDFIRAHWPDKTKNMSDRMIEDSMIARIPTGPLTDEAKMIGATPAVATDA